eukprot:1681010-Amphidinium_carterae.1
MIGHSSVDGLSSGSAAFKGMILPNRPDASQSVLRKAHRTRNLYADGEIGIYHRANRSLQDMIEHAPAWLVNFCASKL